MKGRSVSYAYSMMILIFVCGYSDPAGGILLKLSIIPACIIICASLYSVYWLKKHRCMTAAVITALFIKVYFLDYLLPSIIWYYEMEKKLGEVGFHAVTFFIVGVLVSVIYMLIKLFPIAYTACIGLTLSLVLDDCVRLFVPSDKSFGNWGYLSWGVCALLIFGLCILFDEGFCKLMLPFVSAYLITVASYANHKHESLIMDLTLLLPLNELVLKDKVTVVQVNNCTNEFAKLSGISPRNRLQDVYHRLLGKLLEGLPSILTNPQDAINLLKKNYTVCFPKSVFQDRFYFIMFITLGILLAFIALFTAKTERPQQALK